MDQFEIIAQIEELERKIAAFPPGGIAVKTVNGKQYFYHRITKNKKRTETYIHADQVEVLRAQIEERKKVEAELKKLKSLLPEEKTVRRKVDDHPFSTYVRMGEQLQRFASPVKKYKKREGYSKLREFVFGAPQDRVFILYGLRRTGKTTLIRQIFAEMTPKDLEKAVFMQIKATDSLADIKVQFTRDYTG